MIHFLFGSHVQKLESSFFSDWSKNKGVFEPRSSWLHDSMFDFRYNFKTRSYYGEEDANSKFSAALTMSLEDFIHISFKDE